MSDIKMYAIFDSKTNEYVTPFFAAGDKHALRILSGTLVGDCQLLLYPSDYSLWCLGDFDTEAGLVSQGSMKLISSIRNLVPVSLRTRALDGSFGGADYEEKEEED